MSCTAAEHGRTEFKSLVSVSISKSTRKWTLVQLTAGQRLTSYQYNSNHLDNILKFEE